MMKKMRMTAAVAAVALMALLSSCVHEWPEINDAVELRLKVHHELPWTEYDYVIDTGTRADDPSASWEALYTFRVFRKGETAAPVKSFQLKRDDLSLADFETSVMLPEGDYDIYVWQDLVNAADKGFYDSADFNRITYLKPYTGDTDKRDAFEGRTSVSIPSTIDAVAVVDGEISLERPTAKYVFIATDFDKFYNESVTRFKSPAKKWEQLTPDQKVEMLKDFAVVVRYPLYMPAVYDIFSQKVLDSWTGVTYEAKIRPLNGDEAVVAFDYVFQNHHNSGAQVQLALKTPDGKVTGLTSTLTVPLKRGQITYVRGKFLTASAGSGLNVDFNFDGDFNIKIE